MLFRLNELQYLILNLGEDLFFEFDAPTIIVYQQTLDLTALQTLREGQASPGLCHRLVEDRIDQRALADHVLAHHKDLDRHNAVHFLLTAVKEELQKIRIEW